MISAYETWDVDIAFKQSCYEGGAPYICQEGYALPCLHPQTFLGFDLSPDTTPEEAAALARMMNRHIVRLTLTGPAAMSDAPGRGAQARAAKRAHLRLINCERTEDPSEG